MSTPNYADIDDLNKTAFYPLKGFVHDSFRGHLEVGVL